MGSGAYEEVGRSTAALTWVGHEILGRPTASSISLKALFDGPVEANVEWGTVAGQYSGSTPPRAFSDGVVDLVVDGLSPNTRYYYRLRYRANGATAEFANGDEHAFVTQRSPNAPFTFAIQTDSHQGFQFFYSDELYGITLGNILADQPDFLFDLGDTVSTDDAVETQASVRRKYEDQRAMFELVGHSSSIFLVLGNHENEEGWNLDDGANVASSLPVLGANGRKRYFLNPVPNDFYSGNTDPMPELDGDHLRGDYYAFTWGSALFVAIDPYWYTQKKPFTGTEGGEKDDEVVGNRWNWTLGKQQYDWLEKTLSASDARFKFVFAHHLVGGSQDYGRAGVKGAKYCEWGGYDTDGKTYGFDRERPGWSKPIHQLLVDNRVTVFFHGHDHIFATEELDGVVYQSCPHAANPDYGTGFDTNAEDYADAVRRNNSGHLRVNVAPEEVNVSYVRAFLPRDGTNREIAYTYAIAAGGSAGAGDSGGASSSAGGSSGPGGSCAQIAPAAGRGGDGAAALGGRNASTGGVSTTGAGGRAGGANGGVTATGGASTTPNLGGRSGSDTGGSPQPGGQSGASSATEPASDSGSGCTISGAPRGSELAWWNAVALLTWALHRRSRASRKRAS